jgi:hypothetical protein
VGIGRTVVEPSYPGIGAEVVVEGAILLHQEDDVFDRSEVRARPRGRTGKREGVGRHRPAGEPADSRRPHEGSDSQQSGGTKKQVSRQARRTSARTRPVIHRGGNSTRHARLQTLSGSPSANSTCNERRPSRSSVRLCERERYATVGQRLRELNPTTTESPPGHPALADELQCPACS